jgi:hypothetical protein
MQRSVVLLPEPFAPMKPVIDPAGMDNDTLEIPAPPEKRFASEMTWSARDESGIRALAHGRVYGWLT